MALTKGSISGDSQPPRAPAADAAAVYAGNDATRIHREAGTAAVAAAHTTGSAGESAIGAPFIGEDHKLDEDRRHARRWLHRSRATRFSRTVRPIPGP